MNEEYKQCIDWVETKSTVSIGYFTFTENDGSPEEDYTLILYQNSNGIWQMAAGIDLVDAILNRDDQQIPDLEPLLMVEALSFADITVEMP